MKKENMLLSSDIRSHQAAYGCWITMIKKKIQYIRGPGTSQLQVSLIYFLLPGLVNCNSTPVLGPHNCPWAPGAQYDLCASTTEYGSLTGTGFTTVVIFKENTVYKKN